MMNMTSRALTFVGLTLAPSLAMACGFDWNLPQNHFDGVEEHGYVEYWEKIGDADLGDGLVIPINISFNSHREATSPTLGKGWAVALLESHVEPIDENCMEVVMPDGWNYFFLRNGNTETWRGNAGWVGETNNTVFTITARCGWRIKFDGGKIQEIDSSNNRTLSFRYNGGIATEVEERGKAFVQVKSNPGAAGQIELLINGEPVDISLAQRPQVMTKLNQNLITGFDQSLSQLQWPDGKKESFEFGTDKKLNPTLVITFGDQTQRNFTWDANTRQIKIDGDWIYKLIPGENIALNRINSKGQTESYFNDPGNGTTTSVGIDGVTRITTRFVNAGVLSGKMRNITQIVNGVSTTLNQYSYDEKGKLIRNIDSSGAITTYEYDDQGNSFITQKMKDKVLWKREITADGILKQDVQPISGNTIKVYARSDWQKDASLLGGLVKVRPSLMDSADRLQVNQKKGTTVQMVLKNAKNEVLARLDIPHGALWEYVSKDNLVTTFLNGSKYSEEVLDSNRLTVERRQFTQFSASPTEVQKIFYDANRRPAKIIITDASSTVKDMVTMSYDDKNRMVEETSSAEGTYHYVFTQSGQRRQIFTPPGQSVSN